MQRMFKESLFRKRGRIEAQIKKKIEALKKITKNEQEVELLKVD